jgi:hypothetical protein
MPRGETRKDNTMNNPSLYAPIFYDNVTMVGVCFEPGKGSYTYKTDLALEVDDSVVVEVGDDQLKIGTVTHVGLDIPVEDNDRTYRWVVTRISLTYHLETRLKDERQLVSRVRKARAGSIKTQARAALGIAPELVAQIVRPESDDAT